MSKQLSKIQEEILWYGLSDGCDDWVPIQSLYSATQVCLGTRDFDAVTFLGDVVGYIAGEGIALGGAVTQGEGFIPWALNRRDQEARLRKYISDHPAPFDGGYDVWFVVSAMGGQQMLDYWDAQDKS